MYGILTSCLLLLLTEEVLGSSYIGCYKRQDETSYGGVDALIETSVEADGIICANTCYEAGFRFAGIPNPTTCTCGDVYGVDGEATCSSTCTSTGGECGGTLSISVYTSGRAACFERSPFTNFIGNDSSIVNELINIYNTSGANDCESMCSSIPNCTSYTYMAFDTTIAAGCYAFTVTPAISNMVDPYAFSGKQIPCEGSPEESVVGMAVAVAVVSVLLLLIPFYELRRHKTRGHC